MSAGGFQGLGALLALGELGDLRIVLADSLPRPLGASLAHACVHVPPVKAREDFVAALLEACRRFGLELVVPTTAHELEALSEARPRFEPLGARVAVCPPALLRTLLDKRSAGEFLRTAGLFVPAEVDPEAPDACFPLIAKPRWGWGGGGRVLLPDREAWQAGARACVSAGTHVIQPLLEGWDELSVDFAIGFDGRASAIGVRRRVRVSGGFAVVSETEHDERLSELSARFALRASAEGGCGAFNLQCLRRGGELAFIDVNPRLATSATHWLGSGLHPLAHLLGRAAPGRPPFAPPPGSRARSVRLLRDELEDLDPARESAERGLKGLVFDLDDTLVPHKRWMLARLKLLVERDALLGELGQERVLREALRLVEEGQARVLFDALGGALGLKEAECVRLRAIYGTCHPQRCETYGDVLPALVTLRARGYRLGLLTDNPPDSQRAKLRAAGLEPAFDGLVFANEHGGEKPALDGFRAIEAALGLPAEQLAMVGDNPYRDIAGAQAAGWAAAFLLERAGGCHAFDHELYRQALAARAPLRRIRSLTELVSVLPAQA